MFQLNRRTLSLIGGPLAFSIILMLGPAGGMSNEALAVLASTAWVAIWWISEVVPIPITSLLPIILLPVTRAVPIADVTSAYGHRLIFLYVGGFILAIAIEKWNLHRRIALNIIKLVGTSERMIVLGFMLATAFLSMWISNTATSVMMLPIGMAIVMQLADTLTVKKGKGFGKALMLSIAYAASIGGTATLIGTPPNLVLAGVVQQYYHFEIIFSEWILMVMPVSLLLLVIAWYYLSYVAFDLKSAPLKGGQEEVNQQLKKLGKVTFEEKMVLAVFGVTAFLWITRSFLFKHLIPGMDDTVIAIGSALLLFVLPAKEEKRIMDWESAVKLPWGIVLLFGGGLAIAEGFKTTHLAEWLGGQMHILDGANTFAVLFAIVGSVNFLTEITSNVATTSMILPVLASLSEAIGENPMLLMTGAALAASCAFMLPVATPPNAVVFGSGYLKMSDMVKTGFVLNIISIIILTTYVYFVLPLVW